jgi:hypothetical protein
MDSVSSQWNLSNRHNDFLSSFFSHFITNVIQYDDANISWMKNTAHVNPFNFCMSVSDSKLWKTRFPLTTLHATGNRSLLQLLILHEINSVNTDVGRTRFSNSALNFVAVLCPAVSSWSKFFCYCPISQKRWLHCLIIPQESKFPSFSPL